MNALSKLFETLHLSRRETASLRSSRRRRARRQESALSCETLEPKQLLAADVAVQFSDQVFDTTDPLTIAIEGKFQDTAVSGPVVKFETNAPLADNDFYVELTDNTPLTNANFLSYVNNGAYDNSKFHRSVSNFVIQGGGFQTPTAAADQPGSDPVAIPTTGTIQNEPGNLNTRGTIAMAKLGGQPDSATSQFFFNLSDNSFLDSDNGGYTQFGSVLGSGMTVIDTIGSALTYDATTYYSNTALSDLPLWNVNQDNIVRPQDFVQIENADEVTESALFTYQVSSSDAAKLVASFDGNGNLLLTPDSSATGSVDVTVTATSRLDNSTAIDTFSVQLNGGDGGPVEPELTPVEEAGDTTLNRDQDGNFYAGTSAITHLSDGQTKQLNAATYDPLEIIAVDDFGDDGGKQLVFKAGTSAIYVWALDSNWQRDTSSTQIIRFSDSSGIDAQEVRFGVDINGGGIGSPLSPVESQGSVILQQSGSGALFAGTDAIRYLKNGAVTQLTTSSFGSLQIIAVDDFGVDGGKQLVFKAGTTAIYIWALDSNWQRDTSSTQIIRFSDSSGIETQEVRFGVDINGSGIGSQYTVVESQGAVALQRNDAGALFAGTQPITHLKNGVVTQLTTSSFSGLQIIAVDDLGENGGKQLVFKAPNEVYTWTLDANWQRDTGVSPEVLRLDDLSSIDTKETAFGIDINGAGVGEHFVDVETEGSTRLRKSSLTGKIYADDQPITRMSNGAPVQIKTSDYSNLDIVAVEDLGANGKQLVFKASAEIYIWTLDVTWQRDTEVSPEIIRLSDSAAIDEKELAFGTDFNGGGVGSVLSDIETAGSTLLQQNLAGALFASGSPIMHVRSGVLTQLTTSTYGESIQVVAVEDLGVGNGGKQLVFNAGSKLYFWTMDDGWQRDTATTEILSLSNTDEVRAREVIFGVDFDGGGIGS